MKKAKEERMRNLILVALERLETGGIFPIPKAIRVLFRQLVEKEFIAADSDLRLFSALWGIGGIDMSTYQEGRHVKWLKDKQLLRFFLEEIGYKETEMRDVIALTVFSSKREAWIRLPKKDYARLGGCYEDIRDLQKILKEFS